MQAETRLRQLQLCAMIEDALARTRAYVKRYQHLASRTRLATVEHVLEKLSYTESILVNLDSLICASPEPGYAALLKAYNTLTSNYEHLLILDPPLPGAVKQMYYELYAALRRILDAG